MVVSPGDRLVNQLSQVSRSPGAGHYKWPAELLYSLLVGKDIFSDKTHFSILLKFTSKVFLFRSNPYIQL